MTTRPTAEQKATREQLAEARRRTREKKLRDRRLYRMGEVMEAQGYEEPEDVEALMRTIDEALAYGERDHDAEVIIDTAVERTTEQSDRFLDEEIRMMREPSPLALQLPVYRGTPAASTSRAGTVVVAAGAGALLGLTISECWRRWRRGGVGWTR